MVKNKKTRKEEKFSKKGREDKSAKGKPTSGVRFRTKDETDELVYAVCERFLKPNILSEDSKEERSSTKGVTTAIAEWANEKFHRTATNRLTREKIYPIVWEGVERGFVLPNPPIEEQLESELVAAFHLEEHLKQCDGAVVVCNSASKTAAQNVSYRVADQIISLIKKIRGAALKTNEDGPEVDNSVHIGFGSGYAAMEVAKRLAVNSGIDVPKLTLHAITSSYYLEEQEKDTSAYFTYFSNNKLIDVQCISCNTTPLIWDKNAPLNEPESQRAARWTFNIAEHWQNPSLQFNYEKRDEIDIVVTSLASARDNDGLLKKYLQSLKKHKRIQEDAVQTLNEQGWVGDILFLPYAENGPIFPRTVQAASLFTFNDLVSWATGTSIPVSNGTSKKRYIVLVGGPCADCFRPKDDALYPLLDNPKMRAWTHLIIDRMTAEALIQAKKAAQ